MNDTGETDCIESKEGEITPGLRRAYVLSGNAIVTIIGRDKRFTYRIEARKESQPAKHWQSTGKGASHWVYVLRGNDNDNDFHFMGGITERGFYVSDKGRVHASSLSAQAFSWFWRHPEDARMTVLHAGTCGRCGRLLTTPESIRTGLGPVCARLSTLGK